MLSVEIDPCHSVIIRRHMHCLQSVSWRISANALTDDSTCVHVAAKSPTCQLVGNFDGKRLSARVD